MGKVILSLYGSCNIAVYNDYQCPVPFLNSRQFKTTLKGHPSSRALNRISRIFCCNCILFQLFPLPNPATLNPLQVLFPRALPNELMHTNLHLGKSDLSSWHHHHDHYYCCCCLFQAPCPWLYVRCSNTALRPSSEGRLLPCGQSGPHPPQSDDPPELFNLFLSVGHLLSLASNGGG